MREPNSELMKPRVPLKQVTLHPISDVRMVAVLEDEAVVEKVLTSDEKCAFTLRKVNECSSRLILGMQ